MARTKQEIRDFLNSQVGKKVNAKAGKYNGQCVSLIKALLEFLGAPNPYSPRGNAKDVGDSYVRDGIARSGDGWLRVVVNRKMGVINGKAYGHVWIDLRKETNYEQNGARALHVTKGTRPYSQRQQVVNLDKYIKADPARKPQKSSNLADIVQRVIRGDFGNNPKRAKKLRALGYDPDVVQAAVNAELRGRRTASIKVGSKVRVTNPIDENGTRLVVTGTYDVLEVKGDRIVIGKGKIVTAAINRQNLKEV